MTTSKRCTKGVSRPLSVSRGALPWVVPEGVILRLRRAIERNRPLPASRTLTPTGRLRTRLDATVDPVAVPGAGLGSSEGLEDDLACRAPRRPRPSGPSVGPAAEAVPVPPEGAYDSSRRDRLSPLASHSHQRTLSLKKATVTLFPCQKAVVLRWRPFSSAPSSNPSATLSDFIAALAT